MALRHLRGFKSLLAAGWRLSAFLALVAVGAAPAAGQALFDRVIVGAGGYNAAAVLPAGVFGPAYPIGGTVGPMVFLPDGRLLAATEERPSPLGYTRMALQEIQADGSLRRIGAIETPPGYEMQPEYAEDLAVDREGRFFVLATGLMAGRPRLVELRPEDASTVSSRFLEQPSRGLATAGAGGLWTIDQLACLRPLDPDTGALGGKKHCYSEELSGTLINTADTDSAGRIYFTYAYVCSPPCGYVGSIDPATGELRMEAFAAGEIPAFPIRRVAIARRCEESATARCLQGGRFRAEVRYAGYDGAAGPATAAAARSGDTGIFSFFDENNWELMVKALDGCAINGHFWIYAAASTDVAYTLTVTDTETGARKTYGNPLGQVAVTITDNQAFSCSPADLAASRAEARPPAAAASPTAAAPAAAPLPGTALRHDELVAYQDQVIRRASLPAGPAGPSSPAPAVYALQATPDGRVLAVSDGDGGTVLLSELREDGSLAEIGRVGLPGNPPIAMGPISDLAMEGSGNLWLLGFPVAGPEGPTRTLTLINGASGSVAYFRQVAGEITAIAEGPHGLWAAAGNRLYEVTPTGHFWVHRPAILVPGWQDVASLDIDSAGRVYFAGHRPACAPSCSPIGVYDPRTGLVTAAPDGLPEGPILDLTIRRRCADSPTSRCLQDGRYRAEIAYEGYDGAAGAAQAARARSEDTGIFTFFDPANWELMVKVLDGCAINGHTWVYAAASTDVEYAMTVTDTETGRQKIYRNSLGQVARTVTDNLAFSCSP